jgi:hypothetical protein
LALLEVSSNGENDLVFDVSSGQLVATLTSTQQGQFSRDGTAFVGGNAKDLIAWSTKLQTWDPGTQISRLLAETEL